MTTENRNFTANDIPTLCLSGLLGRKVTSRMVTTKNGPKMAVDFTLLVDLAKGDDGRYPQGKYIRCTAWGDFANVLESLASQPKTKLCVSGWYNVRPERVANDGRVWPASLEFNAQTVYTELAAGTSISNALAQHVVGSTNELPF